MEGIAMWKRIGAALLSLTLTWGMSGGAFAAGNGYETVASSTDAFVKEIVRAQKALDDYVGISSAAQLQEALADPDGLYILLADINLGEWRPETGAEFSTATAIPSPIPLSAAWTRKRPLSAACFPFCRTEWSPICA